MTKEIWMKLVNKIQKTAPANRGLLGPLFRGQGAYSLRPVRSPQSGQQ